MKIVLANNIVHRYAANDSRAAGGAERLQWMLARALAQAGWSVAVGVRERLAPGQEEVIEGVRFVGMEPAETGKAFLGSWSRFLEAEKPDWYYWQGADPLFGAVLLAAKRKGVRGIFSAAFDRDVRPRIALTRKQHLWPLYALGLRGVERIFVQHTGQLSDLNKRLRKKATVIPGVVGLNGNIKSLKQRGNYVAWVAVLRQPKRPDLLVEMARKSPDLRYVVCGGPSTHRTPPGYSEKIVADLRSLPNVEYLGHVPPDRTLETIGNATALLSTSDQEGFPSTFLEAWAAGTPVVSRRVDPDGIIGANGLGFVSNGIDRAISDLRDLMNCPDVFDAASNRSRNYIQKTHSGAAVARAFNDAVGIR